MDDIKREKNRLQQARWRAANPEKARAKVKAWALANREKKQARDRRYRAKRQAARKAEREARPAPTPVQLAVARAVRDEKHRAAVRAHYWANVDRIREKSRAWRTANPGKSSSLQKAWREKNREKVRTNKRNRKATKRVTLVRDLTKLQRGRCAYCRVKLGDDFHVDHVMPLKRGGPDKRSNLQLTCATCNLTKNARHPIEFAQSLGRLL